MTPKVHHLTCLSNKSARSCRFVFSDGRKLLCFLVVTGEPVNPTLNKDQPELGILILPVPLQMLADGNGLLDEVIQILRNFRGKTVGLEDTQDLATSNTLNLSNTQ
ncbi:hypothetical protein V6N13_104926 [Hibiscus sabdariffa]|uniref:Uncharacterized protein n=2 Tax=Hibiscus sabdariffa TaxID=183260 RepID=A0ABR1ZTP8_9ROSI